jgi:hypothetical protein
MRKKKAVIKSFAPDQIALSYFLSQMIENWLRLLRSFSPQQRIFHPTIAFLRVRPAFTAAHILMRGEPNKVKNLWRVFFTKQELCWAPQACAKLEFTQNKTSDNLITIDSSLFLFWRFYTALEMLIPCYIKECHAKNCRELRLRRWSDFRLLVWIIDSSHCHLRFSLRRIRAGPPQEGQIPVDSSKILIAFDWRGGPEPDGNREAPQQAPS